MSKICNGCIYYRPPEKRDKVDEMTKGELKEKIDKGEFNDLPLLVNFLPYPVGKVLEAYQDLRDGSVYVKFEIDTTTPQGQLAAKEVGETLPGIAIGFFAFSRKLTGVALCRKGSKENTVVLRNGQRFLDD